MRLTAWLGAIGCWSSMQVIVEAAQQPFAAGINCFMLLPVQLQVLLFAEELASVVLTPFILAFSLPNCAGERAIPLCQRFVAHVGFLSPQMAL